MWQSIFTYIVHLLRIETLVNGQVCHEVHLVRCQPPDPVEHVTMVVVDMIFSPETVDLPDALDGEERVLDDVVVDVRGGRLQQDAQGLAQYADGGGEHEDAEEEGADGVDEVPFRLEVDHDGCDENAK